MAHCIIRDFTDKHQPRREIVAILDHTADLAALGAGYAPGSLAIVAESSVTIYRANTRGQWVLAMGTADTAASSVLGTAVLGTMILGG